MRLESRTVQAHFNELLRLLILLPLTFAATVFGSFWVWALLGAVTWAVVAAIRQNLRPA